MALTSDQLSQLTFGYLNGADLMQFCPSQLLIAQYEKFNAILQTGCDQAYEEVKGELCNRYDVNKEISNANQFLQNQTGDIQISLAANTLLSRIYFKWNNQRPLIIEGDIAFNSQSLLINGNLHDAKDFISSPMVQVGTSLGGDDIMQKQHINDGLVHWINKTFSSATTLFVSITQGNVDIDLQAQNSSPITSRNNLLVKILSIFAIRNILGSLAGENKMLLGHYEWADTIILKIKERQMSMNLHSAPLPLQAKNEIVSSKFKTLG